MATDGLFVDSGSVEAAFFVFVLPVALIFGFILLGGDQRALTRVRKVEFPGRISMMRKRAGEANRCLRAYGRQAGMASFPPIGRRRG
jgi:hypothetical protein